MYEEIAKQAGVVVVVYSFIEMFLGRVDPVLLLTVGSILMVTALLSKRYKCQNET